MTIAEMKADEKYGRWTTESRFMHEARWYWNCVCDCGLRKPVSAVSLLNGTSKSCGCLRRELIKQYKTKHGCNGRERTPEHWVWSTMKQRCQNVYDASYHEYGGRGIGVCDRWQAFENFLTDLGRRPTSKHTLERINNDGNYEPANCRWATRKEQARNRRSNTRLLFCGENLTIAAWADRTGFTQQRICARLKMGWSVEKTLSTPLRVTRQTQLDRQPMNLRPKTQ